MNTLSRTITGTTMVIIGLILLGVPLFGGLPGFIAWIYGIPILVLGLFILFNDREDNIEQRKDQLNSRRKK